MKFRTAAPAAPNPLDAAEDLVRSAQQALDELDAQARALRARESDLAALIARCKAAGRVDDAVDAQHELRGVLERLAVVDSSRQPLVARRADAQVQARLWQARRSEARYAAAVVNASRMVAAVEALANDADAILAGAGGARDALGRNYVPIVTQLSDIGKLVRSDDWRRSIDAARKTLADPLHAVLADNLEVPA